MEAYIMIYNITWKEWAMLIWVMFALYLFVKNSFKIRDELSGFPLNELTVIVPFRNEKDHLRKLLASIIKQNKQPLLYLFVDDHSDDDGAQIIQKELSRENIPFEVMALPLHKMGKKNALEHGILKAQSKYVHTLDADIWFHCDFFEKLPKPEAHEMMILPVRMVGTDIFTKILELEYGSFQILQAGVARDRPLMASGANLIADRMRYLKTNDLSKHAHRASGDDQYALALFLAEKRKVNTYYDSEIAVYTQTPNNLKKLLQQRSRWMGNNTPGNDWRAVALSILILGVNVVFLLVMFEGLFFGFTSIEFSTLGLKFLADFLMYFNWFKRNDTWRLSMLLPLLSVLYPFYLLNLLWCYLQGKKRTWKSRPIEQVEQQKEHS